MDTLTAKCTKCDVALEMDDIHNDDSIVKCPSCGTEFGRWGDVKVQIKKMAAGKLKDMAFEAVKDFPWIKVR